MSETRQAMLARIPIFAPLAPPELEELAKVCGAKQLQPRDYLFHEGSPGDQIYLVVSGRLKVSRRSAAGDEMVINMLGPGEIIGELGLLGGGKRTATIEAKDPVDLLVIQRRDFLPFLRAHPDVAIKMLEVMVERLRRITELVEDTAFLKVPARLAKMLLGLARRHADRTPDGSLRLDLQFSQEELGELVAATRESVNKHMKAWSEQGILSMDRGRVTIHRPAALEGLASVAPPEI